MSERIRTSFDDNLSPETEKFDRLVERYVDTLGIGYYEARLMAASELESPTSESGPPPLHKNHLVPRGRPNRQGPQYGEEEGVGYTGDRPSYYQKHEPLSLEQASLNRLNAQIIRGGAIGSQNPN